MSQDEIAPKGRDAVRAQTRGVGAPWRVGGIAVIFVAAIALVLGSGAGRRAMDLFMLSAFGLLAAGWGLVWVGVHLRMADRRRRSGTP